MNWIQHPVLLEGHKVKLVPLTADYFDALLDAAQDASIWTHLVMDGTDRDALLLELKSAVIRRTSIEEYPFVVIDKAGNKVIGSTRFYNILPNHRKLEIGWTWYHSDYWGKGYNTECKLLLLTYCFEVLKAVRVQFQVGEHNLRSQAAVTKIGAQYEGLLRKERIRPNGTIRNTMMYSIIDDEWEGVKKGLEQRLA